MECKDRRKILVGLAALAALPLLLGPRGLSRVLLGEPGAAPAREPRARIARPERSVRRHG
jgi:hypothetical protein